MLLHQYAGSDALMFWQPVNIKVDNTNVEIKPIFFFHVQTPQLYSLKA